VGGGGGPLGGGLPGGPGAARRGWGGDAPSPLGQGRRGAPKGTGRWSGRWRGQAGSGAWAGGRTGQARHGKRGFNEATMARDSAPPSWMKTQESPVNRGIQAAGYYPWEDGPGYTGAAQGGASSSVRQVAKGCPASILAGLWEGETCPVIGAGPRFGRGRRGRPRMPGAGGGGAARRPQPQKKRPRGEICCEDGVIKGCFVKGSFFLFFFGERA